MTLSKHFKRSNLAPKSLNYIHRLKKIGNWLELFCPLLQQHFCLHPFSFLLTISVKKHFFFVFRHNIYFFLLTEEIAAAESALVLADYSNATKPIPKPPRIPKTSQSKPPAVAANVNPSSRPHTPVSNYKRDSPGWYLLFISITFVCCIL